MLKPHDLKAPEGARKRRKRVGRGIAGKGGKTAGRGHKGQRARSKVHPWFEGGQMALTQRVPKRRGFRNPFRVEYQAINLDTLAESGLDEVSPEIAARQGARPEGGLRQGAGPGRDRPAPSPSGSTPFSGSARQAIESAGGSVDIVPLPFGDRRPPADGNAAQQPVTTPSPHPGTAGT